MLPETNQRVAKHTAPEMNQRIRKQIESNIESYSGKDPALTIGRRLQELEREWDIERTLETNAAVATLAGLALGVMVNRKLLLLPALVAGFLLQHALQGWCPPVPIFRARGFRTAREIEAERNALKAIRGDYQDLAQGDGQNINVQQALGAACR